MQINVRRLAAETAHPRLMNQNARIWQRKALFRRAPTSKTAAIDAAWPTQVVTTSGFTNCIVS